jgi:Predicted RNA polymerase sigma factor containing a TPR repeat domain
MSAAPSERSLRSSSISFVMKPAGSSPCLQTFFGWQNFDLVEEMVQSTLVDALQSWRIRGIPDNPSGWMHRVAKNKVLDALRRQGIAQRVSKEWASRRSNPEATIDELFLDSQIEDSQLRMMFAVATRA